MEQACPSLPSFFLQRYVLSSLQGHYHRGILLHFQGTTMRSSTFSHNRNASVQSTMMQMSNEMLTRVRIVISFFFSSNFEKIFPDFSNLSLYCTCRLNAFSAFRYDFKQSYNQKYSLKYKLNYYTALLHYTTDHDGAQLESFCYFGQIYILLSIIFPFFIYTM